MVIDVLWCILTTAGILLFVWCAVSRWLLPVVGADLVATCCISGSGDQLEQTVRGFVWLHQAGLLDMSLRIVDCGLSEDGLLLATKLAQKYPYIELVKE